MLIKNIPLTLYIHYPWCESKCPYCDFNSHTTAVDNSYINALIDDLKNSLHLVQGRKIAAIFIGGGTPSLMTTSEIDKLFNALNKYLTFDENAEITIESNPSSSESAKFEFYKSVGINRLSIGVQSFDDKFLQFLGRAHDSKQAQKTLENADKYFDNFNLDIIFGLQNQNLKQSANDLKTAFKFNPTHISFYQLTIEPNTYFAKFPPILPSDENLYQMMEGGINLLAENNYQRYEVSAYGKASKHNLNYWNFGDYIGIGSGAHGKITTSDGIFRTTKNKSPKDYIKDNSAKNQSIENLGFDFMLNALRLKNGFDKELFEKRTGQKLSNIDELLQKAQNLELITINKKITPTELGFNHLNSLQEIFLDS
jgi:putative oxygen-independent coproporphyrinogen III oxidase